MLNYQDRLRHLALNDQSLLREVGEGSGEQVGLDASTLAIARLAALIAIGGGGISFGEEVDAALSAGASTDEIVGVLIGIRSIVGVPRVVAAAPLVAVALGVDVEWAGE